MGKLHSALDSYSTSAYVRQDIFLTTKVPLLGVLYFLGMSCSSPLPELKRTPEGPCWSVTLDDGFSSGDELINTFHCLNNSNNFDAFLPSVEKLHDTDRDQSLLKDNLAEIANQILLTETSLPVSVVHDFLEQHPVITTDITTMLRISLYGKENIENPFDESLLYEGIIYPTISLIPQLSSYLLDNPDKKETLEYFLFSSHTQEILCTFFGLMQNPNTQSTMFSLPQKLGQAVESTYNINNDLWADAGENSAIWFINTLSSSQENDSPLSELAIPMENLLADTRIRTPLKEIILEQFKPDLFPAILHLIDVDRSGNPRGFNSPSALYDIFSIMEQSNAPLECSLSIFSFSVSTISIDNLAVELLSRIGNESPETVDTALSLLDVLNLGITDWMLDQIVASEVCPILTYDFVSRFQALQRLNDPQVAPLLTAGLDIIKVLRHPTQSRLPDLADIMSIIHRTGLTMPAEELINDILSSPLLIDGIALIPYLEDITATCPTDIEPISYSTFLNVSAELLSEEHRDSITSMAAFLIEQEEVWDIYERSSPIMQSTAIESLLPTLHNLDLYTVDLPNIDNETRDLIYKSIEYSELSETFIQYDPQNHTPLTWLGVFVIDDTANQLVSMIAWLDDQLSLFPDE